MSHVADRPISADALRRREDSTTVSIFRALLRCRRIPVQLRLPLHLGLTVLVWIGCARLPSAQAAEQGRKIDAMGAILPLRERVAVENRVLAERLETLLPRLMEESGLDMWLVIARGSADDPVYATMVPQRSFNALRTTMLVFHRLDDGTVERSTVSRYRLGDLYTLIP